MIGEMKLICHFLLLAFHYLACVGANTPIYFGFVSTDESTSAELTPSLDVALSTINNSSSVLPGYQLTPVRWTSECDRNTSLSQFLDHVLEKCDGTTGWPTILGVVGCGCTVADLPVAELVHHWNIPQISYSVNYSLALQDEKRFPNYFQMHSLENWAKTIQGLLSEFNWTRLAVLTDNSTRFIEMDQVIRSLLTTFEVTMLQEIILNETAKSIEMTLGSLGDDYRILFLNTYSETTRDVFCYAAREGLVFPRYVWIVYGWYSSDWWVASQSGGCTNEVIERFLDDSRVLALQPYPVEDDLITGGITRSEFKSLYKAAQEGSGVSSVPEAPLIYDTVWTLALALNKTLANRTPASNSCSSGLPLEDFAYNKASLGNEIREAISNVTFTGASGDVKFDQNGRRQQTFMAVTQYRNGKTVDIGRISVSTNGKMYNLTYIEIENQSTVFPGIVPMDGTPIKVIFTFDPWIIGVCYSLTIIGLVFNFICLLFNFAFRNRRVVRLTSPNLNYFILLGTTLVYCTIFVHIIPTTDHQVYKIRCYIQAWTVTTGFTLVFGTVIAKMYRVVHIFKNPSPDKKKLDDWKLMILIFAIAAVGIILLIIEIAVPQFRFEPVLRPSSENPNGLNELGITEEYCSWRCIGGDPVAFYFQIIYYTYMLAILSVSLALAFQTRTIKIEVLNDSKWISGIVFIVVPVVVTSFVFTPIAAAYVHLNAAIFCIGLFISSSTTLGFIFLPKMVALAKDPKGENVFARSTNFSAHSGDGTNTANGKQVTMVTADNSLNENNGNGTCVNENSQ